MNVMNEKEVAQMLALPVRTVQIWRSRGQGPYYLKIGRNVRYREEDVLKFIDASVVNPAAIAKK